MLGQHLPTCLLPLLVSVIARGGTISESPAQPGHCKNLLEP
jgi:hypothetical protein